MSLSLKSPLRTQQHLRVFLYMYMNDVCTLYIHMYMYMIIHIVNTTTHGLKKELAGGLTFEILGLKESHFEGENQAKFFASVTCMF